MLAGAGEDAAIAARRITGLLSAAPVNDALTRVDCAGILAAAATGARHRANYRGMAVSDYK